MRETFIIYVVLSVGLIAYLLRLLAQKDENSRLERRQLEDRIMALTEPGALSMTLAARDELQPARITYVDEEPGTRITRRSYSDAEA